MLTERIGDSTITEEYDLSGLSKENDDGWFSGEFPTYSETKNKSPIEDQRPMKKDTIVQKEKPVFVESLSTQDNKNVKNWIIYR